MRINIDATRVGNFARFINHSCDGGNLSTVLVRSSGALLPRLCFFASKNILEGEELTFSYGDIRLGKKGLQCFCGSSSCFGILPSEHTWFQLLKSGNPRLKFIHWDYHKLCFAWSVNTRHVLILRHQFYVDPSSYCVVAHSTLQVKWQLVFGNHIFSSLRPRWFLYADLLWWTTHNDIRTI